MALFILTFIASALFLWTILIENKKARTDFEQYIEDNVQMQFLKEYQNKHCIK